MKPIANICLPLRFMLCILLLVQLSVYAQPAVYNRSGKDSIYYSVNSLQAYRDLKEKSFDHIRFLRINLFADSLSSGEVFSFSQIKTVNKIDLHATNFKTLDTALLHFKQSLEILILNLHELDTFPDYFQYFTQLKTIILQVDSLDASHVLILDRVLKAPALINFSLAINAQKAKLHLGAHTAHNLTVFEIRGTPSKAIQSIDIDSSFFKSLICRSLELSADTIRGFTGSNTFAAFDCILQCKNTLDVLQTFKTCRNEWVLNVQEQYSTRLSLINLSGIDTLPTALFDMGFTAFRFKQASHLKQLRSIHPDPRRSVYIYMDGLKGSKALFEGLQQSPRLHLILKLDRCRYRWIKHLRHLGQLDLSMEKGRHLSWRVQRFLKRLQQT